MGRGQGAPEGCFLGLPALPSPLEVPSMHCETSCWLTGDSINAICAFEHKADGNTDLLMAPGDLLTMSDVDPTVAQLKRPAVQENCEGNGAGFHYEMYIILQFCICAIASNFQAAY